MEQIHNHFQSIIHSENDKPAILDIGSGSGYLTVAMAAFFNYKCQVIGIEHIAQLTEFAIENTKRFNQSLLNENVVKFITADGTQGWIAEAPYDVIHVGAACLPDIPQILQEQLKCGGILICPVGNNIEIQRMNIIKKDLNGKFLVIKDISVRFVPLKKK